MPSIADLKDLYNYIGLIVTLVAIVSMFRFRKDAIFIAIIAWFLFPKVGRINLFGGPFNIINIFYVVISLSLFVVSLTAPKTETNYIYRNERRLIFAFFLMLVLQYTFGAAYVYYIYNYNIFSNYQLVIHEFSSLFYLYACYKLLRNRKSIDKIIKLIFVLACIILVEYAATYYVIPKVLPGTVISAIYNKLVLNSQGRFISLFLTDESKVAIILGIGYSFSLVMCLLERKKLYKIWAFLFLLAVLMMVERGTLLGMLAATMLVVMYGKFTRNSRRMTLSSIGVFILVVAFIPTYAYFHYSPCKECSAKAGMGLTSVHSYLSRVGQNAYAEQVTLPLFPFGVGLRNVVYIKLPASTERYTFDNQDIQAGYDLMDTRFSDPQIGPLVYTQYYGLFGLFVMCLALYYLYRNFRRYRFLTKRYAISNRYMSFSIYPLVVFAGFLGSNSYPNLFWITFVCFHLSFFSVDEIIKHVNSKNFEISKRDSV